MSPLYGEKQEKSGAEITCKGTSLTHPRGHSQMFSPVERWLPEARILEKPGEVGKG